MDGAPFSCKVETSASPVARFVIACWVSKSGLGRKVLAVALTAAISRGV